MKTSIKKHLYLFFPIAAFIIALGIFNQTYKTYENEYYDLIFQDKCQQLDVVANSIDTMVAYKQDYKSFVDILLFNQVKAIDAETGVYGRVLDIEFNEILAAHYISEKETPIYLFSNADYDIKNTNILKDRITKANSGVVNLELNDRGSFRIYFRKVPSANSEYILIVGVDKSSYAKQLNVNNFKFGFSFVGFIMLISLFMVVNHIIEDLKEEEEKLKQKKQELKKNEENV